MKDKIEYYLQYLVHNQTLHRDIMHAFAFVIQLVLCGVARSQFSSGLDPNTLLSCGNGKLLSLLLGRRSRALIELHRVRPVPHV